MNTLRRVVPLLLLVMLAVVVVRQVQTLLDDPTVWPPDDYVEYWAAGKLAWQGQNPYSPELLLPLQVAAGRDTDEAIMMWNPPWTLPVVLTIAVLPARVGQLVWLLVGVGCMALGIHLFARQVPERKVAVWFAAVIFIPTALVLQAGQIGPLLFVGAAICCAFAGTRPMLAGAALVLVSMKPHLAYLVWLALVLDAITTRRWKLLGAGVVLGIIMMKLPLLLVPHVYQDYLTAMREHPPAQWVSLTLGTLLRLMFGEANFGLQFVPMLLGVGWLGCHWWPRRRTWDWAEELPLLLLVSFLTSPYGAWHFDLVLLLVPVLHRLKSLAVAPLSVPVLALWLAYFAMNAAMLSMNVAGLYSYWFCWVAPALLVWDQVGRVILSHASQPKLVPA